MTLDEFLVDLLILKDEGHGSKQVFYVHGSSGDVGPLSSAQVTDYIGECGPFDLKDGEEYVSIYAGN
jgi:hypothetical protein